MLGPHDPVLGQPRLDPYLQDGAGSLYGIIATLLPGFGAFHFPSKLLTFSAVAMAVLAAAGWDRVTAGETKWPHRFGLMGLGMSLVGLVFALAARAGCRIPGRPRPTPGGVCPGRHCRLVGRDATGSRPGRGRLRVCRRPGASGPAPTRRGQRAGPAALDRRPHTRQCPADLDGSPERLRRPIRGRASDRGCRAPPIHLLAHSGSTECQAGTRRVSRPGAPPYLSASGSTGRRRYTSSTVCLANGARGL